MNINIPNSESLEWTARPWEVHIMDEEGNPHITRYSTELEMADYVRTMCEQGWHSPQIIQRQLYRLMYERKTAAGYWEKYVFTYEIPTGRRTAKMLARALETSEYRNVAVIDVHTGELL